MNRKIASGATIFILVFIVALLPSNADAGVVLTQTVGDVQGNVPTSPKYYAQYNMTVPATTTIKAVIVNWGSSYAGNCEQTSNSVPLGVELGASNNVWVSGGGLFGSFGNGSSTRLSSGSCLYTNNTGVTVGANLTFSMLLGISGYPPGSGGSNWANAFPQGSATFGSLATGGAIFGEFNGSTASPSGLSSYYFVLCDTVTCSEAPADVSTRFISVEPYATTTASTTVTLSADIYYNGTYDLSPYISEVCVDLYYEEPQFSQINFTAEQPHLCMPITASGESGVSTTTRLLAGLWSAVWYFYGSADDIRAYSTSTAFVVVSTQTPPNYFTQNPDGSFSYATTSPDLVPRLENCNLTDFSLGDCLSSLFSWQPIAMRQGFNNFYTGVLYYFPFGYLTRTIEIMQSPATTTLPLLTYTFADDFPVSSMQGVDIYFDFWGTLQSSWNLLANDIKSTGDDPQSMWDIVEPVFKSLIYFTLLFVMIGRIIGVELFSTNNLGKRGALSDNSPNDDSYRLKEYLYKNRKR